ncbi:branched-chain amino acid ABC transporter substrate-binding protein [Hydrogenophaga sp.]|uniref:branched-chain amino acid ABC transporter substrate-binding protein n=1 Tax=Hydrogenophaga sp. TaxID=1904254 RepID=UPI00262D5F6D|nr:branched-chain amino acid ABC transporter substrate-binding protein [Hydrogenophaga sp.]MCW5654373.1 branched-chain amino acid ABC transporter substrate-binding protein [Hydrogenophaga sp.]
MKTIQRTAAFVAASLACGLAWADVVKIAHIDPFSGPAAAIVENANKTLRLVVDIANKENWASGHTFEVVNFDGKGSPQESLQQLKSAADQGIRYIAHAHSSAVAAALIDAINRHNERNPGKELIYLDVTNGAPELTNEKCSFWHFRFDSHQDMKTQGLVSYMATLPDLKKVYLINQNYSTGQQTSAGVKAVLKQKRPDIEIVGDDLHPMLAVKDFAPYVAKIKASGAQAVVTANWSADLTLLIKAAKDASLKVPFFTYNAATTGVPTALASANADDVKLITYWNPNDYTDRSKSLIEPFRAKYNDDFVVLPYYSTIKLLSGAMAKAKTTEPVAVAKALEGLKVMSMNGEIEMRKLDHQIQQSQVVSSWTKADGKTVKYDLEKTGYGWKTLQKLEPYVSSLPTSCQMKRPG